MPNLRQRFITGAAWMSALRWAVKLLGLVNTAVLARLLAPEDFGLMAMAMLAVSFVEIWFGFGVELALIQNNNATREDYDTAWTVRIIQGICVGLILAAASPLAAHYFHEPRLPPLLWLMAAAIALSGAANIGTVNFQKELNFKQEFIFSVIGKLSGVIITIVLAYWLKNYWALAFGIFFGYSFGFALSYVMHPYRPRFSLKKIRSLWAFSQWMLLSNIGGFATQKADELIVGAMAPASALGIYSVSLDVGQMVTNELAYPINRVMLPLLSKLQGEAERMRGIYLKIMASVNTLTLPAGVGLAFCAPYVVAVVLGTKWQGAIPYLQIFALYGALRFTYSGANAVLMALGKVRSVSALQWVEAVLLVGFCIIGGMLDGLFGIALARLLVAFAMGMVTVYFLTRLADITIVHFFHGLWRPVLSVVAMATVLALIPKTLFPSPLLALLGYVTVAALTYSAALLLLWWKAGKPDGIEPMVLAACQRAYRKMT